MAHMEKYTRAQCGQMLAHYGREREPGHYGNEDIKPERTKENYNLAPDHNASQMEIMNERLSSVKILNRKDVNVMCDWAVTAPKDLPAEQTNDFFQESYNFLAKRYGERNVISSYVHMDESTPHMHFAFIPVTYDQKKSIEKVNAHEVVDREDLQSFHKDLQTHMNIKGIKANVLNGATVGGNLSIEELKAKTLMNERLNVEKALNKANKSLKQQIKKTDNLKQTEKRLVDKVTGIKAQEKELAQRKESLDERIGKFNDSVKSIKEIPQGKTTLTGKVQFEPNEAKKLLDTANVYVKTLQNNDILRKNNTILKETVALFRVI